jgi:hypothetical protein
MYCCLPKGLSRDKLRSPVIVHLCIAKTHVFVKSLIFREEAETLSG